MHNLIRVSLFGLLCSVNAYGDTWESGSFKVKQLRLGGSGVHVTLDPAPQGCGGGDNYGTHFVVSPQNQEYYKDMVSGLLAAYTANIKITELWFRNEGVCSNSHVLELYMYKFESK